MYIYNIVAKMFEKVGRSCTDLNKFWQRQRAPWTVKVFVLSLQISG